MKLFLLFSMLVSLQVQSKLLYEEEQRLVTKLFETYPDVLPTANGPVNVIFGLTLNQIVDVDEKQQILTTSAWVRQNWNNPSLSWNPEEYMNISHINILSKRIWKPDIVLYDSVSDSGSGGHLDKLLTRVIVNSSGYNQWMAPVMFRSHCKIDVRMFPFDQQTCIVKFGSWTYDGTRLDIIPEVDSADLRSFKTNSEWCLIDFPAKRNVKYYACCDEPYVDLTYTLRIERRPLFYIFNLILPCACLTALTVLSFCLPPESGERVSLSITIILAMTVFMFIVADKVPPNSDSLPLIGIFYFACMVEETLGLIAVCYTLSLYYTDPQWFRMPSWVRWIVADWAGRLVGIDLNLWRRNQVSGRNQVSRRNSVTHSEHTRQGLHPRAQVTNCNDVHVDCNDDGKLVTITPNGHADKRRMSRKMSRYESMSGPEKIEADYWKLAAMIADRIMFIVFLITIAVTFIAIFATVTQECKQ